MSIGAYKAAGAEGSAEAEYAEVVSRGAPKAVLTLGGIKNAEPPQSEKRSATGACTSFAAVGTVTAALAQARAVAEGKVTMFKNTPSEVTEKVRKEVTS